MNLFNLINKKKMISNFDPVQILIVEDNPNDAELTLRALRKHNLLNEVYIAEDGQEALDFVFCEGKFASRNISSPLKVIFLDLKLPKISGLEVLERIKSNPKTKKLPVVIVTSSKEDPDIKAAYQLGTNGYVVKPVDFNDFIKVIQNTGLFWLLVNESPK
jgi:two-component system response regulator